MSEQSSAPSAAHGQKMQIEEWLRQADRHIRAARYIAADEALQKVFEVDPTNEVAEAYHGRIQFFIKQVSQRVGMNVELQAEIRKYNELVARRKVNEVQSYLVKGQKALEEGQLKKASDYVKKALAFNPDNAYAHALKRRIEELQKSGIPEKNSSESVAKLRTVVLETWRDGAPPVAQQNIIKKMQEELGITIGTRLALEREVRNSLYKDALREIWNTGGLSAFTSTTIDELRHKFAISMVDHSFVEGALLKEVRKNKVKATILVLDEDEGNLLEIAKQLRLNSYAVVAAGNIEEALRTVKTITPDVILSEVNFSAGPLGFEFFEFIRSVLGNHASPFFFMTKSLDRTTAIIGKRLGVDDFITKPIDFEMLIASITGKLQRNTSSRKVSKKLS
jgi:CheY-like chemotaxis protein